MATTARLVVARRDTAGRLAAHRKGRLTMPRKRLLPPEVQCQDRIIGSGVVLILNALSERYPTAGLNAAASLVDAFVDSTVLYPRVLHPSPTRADDPVQMWEDAVADTLQAVPGSGDGTE